MSSLFDCFVAAEKPNEIHKTCELLLNISNRTTVIQDQLRCRTLVDKLDHTTIELYTSGFSR